MLLVWKTGNVGMLWAQCQDKKSASEALVLPHLPVLRVAWVTRADAGRKAGTRSSKLQEAECGAMNGTLRSQAWAAMCMASFLRVLAKAVTSVYITR